MAQKGDRYTVILKKSHINWGTHRYTGSRGDVYGEGYLPIPRDFAVRHDILNSNGTNKRDIPGKNLFFCESEDGWFRGYLRAQGCNNAGDIYAKQFAADKDLKGLGSWYQHVDAEEGSRVTVTWTSQDHIEISINNVASSLSQGPKRQPIPKPQKSQGQISFEKPDERPAIAVHVEKPVIGEIIRHKVFGLGKVIRIDDNYICVDFSGTTKEFPFPDSFIKGFLTRS